MKYITLSLCILGCFLFLNGATACSTDDMAPPPETPGSSGNPTGTPEEPENTDKMKVEIKIGTTTFTATLHDNVTAVAFKAMLLLTIQISELNRNEKYYNFSGSFPTAPSRPGTIRSGDLMLYGNNCLVLFYKTFTSSYSYTPIGRIDNPTGLEAAVGTGNVTITFEQPNKQQTLFLLEKRNRVLF
ncbi:MAG: hypothetical protein LIO97_09750 [Tannerellaceae bacterium]|nr:hypothetical protein [Tannerellaceae bacterium]